MSSKLGIAFLVCSFLSTAICGCSSAPEASDSAPIASVETQPIQKSQAAQDQDRIQKLQEKIQDLETRLSALNDKINLENGAKTEAEASETIPTENVQAPSAHAKVIPTEKALVQDEAIDRYREAKILYDSKRYSDAIVEFAEFVKNEPEHVLAPAAQYFMGMSYAEQKEYKLAEEELSRGLLSYPHSDYVPDTLLSLARVSDVLQKPERALYYRQKLLSHFPNSPQAKDVSLDSAPAPKSHQKASSVEAPQAPVPPTAPNVPSNPDAEGDTP